MRSAIIMSFALMFSFALASCQEKASADMKEFGETFDASSFMSVGDAITKVENEKGASGINIEGEVTSVCQVKGCWMNVKDDKTGKEMFVKFKDYGFFMPKDLSGKRVVMHGEAFSETISVEDLRHFAEDEGKSKEEIEAITEPEQSISFMASGVKIL